MHGISRGLVRGCVTLLVAVALIAGALGVVADGAVPAANTPATPALAAIEAGLDATVASDPLHHHESGNPFAALAYTMDTLARGAQLFAASDPARSRRYVSLAMNIADLLVAQDARSPDGHLGWGLPKAWDAFGDGTVNPHYQVYGFQTGLVSWALLDTYAVTDRPVYLETVERVMASYQGVGTWRLGAGCADCFMFWYSTSRNDAGRYVKNTNVLMGMALASLYHLTGKRQYAAVARAVYNEETWEIARRGNYGYLGVDDPNYSPLTGPEAHIVLETFAYSQLASLLGLSNGQVVATLNRMDATFWNCGAACLASPVALGSAGQPNEDLQFMTCYPVTFNPVYAPRCAKLAATPRQFPLVLFPLIGLLYALPGLPAR